MPQNDVVIDADRMSRYGRTGSGSLSTMFQWLHCCGSLCVSRHLLVEYGRQNSMYISALLNKLMTSGRLATIKRQTVEAFNVYDRHYRYTCNAEDIPNARLVFRSFRKVLISNDERLRKDVNDFGLVNGVQPKAYAAMPAEMMVTPLNGVCPANVHRQILVD